MNQNSRLVDRFVGIKAKTVIKHLIPYLKTQFEGKPKSVSSGDPSPPQMEANQFLPATTVPPVPQTIQSRTKVIDWDQIFYPDTAEELLLPGI